MGDDELRGSFAELVLLCPCDAWGAAVVRNENLICWVREVEEGGVDRERLGVDALADRGPGE